MVWALHPCLNLGLGIRHETKEEVIVVELRPGQGTMALDLGHPDQNRLGNLLNKKIAEITPEAIENEIITDSSGVKLLMSSYNPKEASFVNAVAEMETLVNQFQRWPIIYDRGYWQFTIAKYRWHSKTLQRNCHRPRTSNTQPSRARRL